jgi:hypothetical protein
MGHLACDEGERALSQTHQARIGMAMGIVNEVIQLHARIAGDVERTPIREANTKLAIWSGLNNIAAINQIAHLRLLGTIRQISRDEDRGGMLNPNRALYDERFTDRTGVKVRGRLWSTLAPGDARLKAHPKAEGEQQPKSARVQKSSTAKLEEPSSPMNSPIFNPYYRRNQSALTLFPEAVTDGYVNGDAAQFEGNYSGLESPTVLKAIK